MEKTLYYLPGQGGRMDAGLGPVLSGRGFDLAGRETRGEFNDLIFSDQVATVAEDLETYFWHEGALVLANSFGAYLFLHAQSRLRSFPGKVLLLSPIVGGFADDATGRCFSPPQPDLLKRASAEGRINMPSRCEIHVGEEDWQSHPPSVLAFAEPLNIPVVVWSNQGHNLEHQTVSGVLDGWLPR
jgi:hypothetical protein